MSKNTRNPQADSLFRQRYGHSPNIMSPNIHARRMGGAEGAGPRYVDCRRSHADAGANPSGVARCGESEELRPGAD